IEWRCHLCQSRRLFCHLNHNHDPIVENDRLSLDTPQYRGYEDSWEYIQALRQIGRMGLAGYFDLLTSIGTDRTLPGNALKGLQYLGGRTHAACNRLPDPEYRKISRVLRHSVLTSYFSERMRGNINVTAHHRLRQGTGCLARFHQIHGLFPAE